MAWHGGFWNSAQSPIHIVSGKQVKITGKVTMIDSEKGWIGDNFKVTSSLDLN
jgi:hypothetical protein